jgi:hypothetical protein
MSTRTLAIHRAAAQAALAANLGPGQAAVQLERG